MILNNSAGDAASREMEFSILFKRKSKILFILIDKLHGCATLLLSTIVEYASKWLSLLLKDKIK